MPEYKRGAVLKKRKKTSGIIKQETEQLFFCQFSWTCGEGGVGVGEMKLSDTHWTASTLLPEETIPVQTGL